MAHVGERQQRLLRELEKIALGLDPDAQVDADMVDELTAASAERKAWSLADALVAGDPQGRRDVPGAAGPGRARRGLIYWMSARGCARRTIARALDARAVAGPDQGAADAVPAADQLIADARRIGAERLEQAICLIADLSWPHAVAARRRHEDTGRCSRSQEIAA